MKDLPKAFNRPPPRIPSKEDVIQSLKITRPVHPTAYLKSEKDPKTCEQAIELLLEDGKISEARRKIITNTLKFLKKRRSETSKECMQAIELLLKDEKDPQIRDKLIAYALKLLLEEGDDS